MLSLSSCSNADQLCEVPKPQSFDNSQESAALLLARIQQLENEKAEQEETNAMLALRILELEKAENARLKRSYTRQKGKEDIAPKKKMKCRRRNIRSPSKSIHLPDVLLLESLPYLERWDLDGMPMVGRQFLRVTAPFEEAQTSRFQQRRMIDYFERNTESLEQAGPNSLFDKHLASHSIHSCLAVESHGKCAITLSDEALLQLIRHNSRHSLHAKRSVIHCYEEHDDLVRFASLWDGCALEVHEAHEEWEYGDCTATTGYFSPEIVGKCSSLHIEHRLGYCNWRGLSLGDPLSGITRCPKVVIGGNECVGISFNDIADHLFASLHHGQKKRELEISAIKEEDDMFDDREDNLESLIARIRERMSSSASEQVPAFTLKLVLLAPSDHEPMLGTFELLGTQACDMAATSNSRVSYGDSSGSSHHCTLVVEEGEQYFDQRRRKVLRITVECA